MLNKTIIPIADKTWLISEYLLDNFYLLEGDDKALLIDTGAGLGPTKEEILSLTDKPLIIAATHGHGDHIGGSFLFDVPTYLHSADMSMVTPNGMLRTDNDMRKSYALSRGKVRNPKASEKELLDLVPKHIGPAKFITMEEGKVFELGNRSVEVIHTPGHSLGSVCFLDKKVKLLFTGDTANDCLLLNSYPLTTTVKVYQNSINKLWNREKEFDGICQGHDCLEIADKSFLYDYLEATDKIIRGDIKNELIDDGLHKGIGIYHNKIRLFYDPNHIE